MLMSLAQRVNQTQLQEKDPDAENLLGRELGANPDALYIMAQTVLVQDIALQQAKAQVTQLQQQVQQTQANPQPAHATSFLGSLFGRHDSAPPQPPVQQLQPQTPPNQSGQAPPYQPGQAPPYQPVPQYQQPQYQQPGPPPYQPSNTQYYPPPQQPQFMAAPVGQPSFMRGAMQTAAGVAAGALAFEGVESILHGFGHGGGYGGGFGGFGGGMAGLGMGPGMGMGGGFERPVEETVVNNYYGDRAGGGVQGATGMFGGEQRFDGGGDEGHFHQPADQFGRVGGGDGGAQLSDASYTVPDASYAAPEAGYNVSDANYATQSNEDLGQGGYDQNLADDSAAYDNSVDDVQIDDGGGVDDAGGGFDDNGGGDVS